MHNLGNNMLEIQKKERKEPKERNRQLLIK